MLTHAEKITAVAAAFLLLAVVVAWLFDRYVLVVSWWPLVGRQWRAERRDTLDLPGPMAEQDGNGGHAGAPDRAGEPIRDTKDPRFDPEAFRQAWGDEPSTDDDADAMIAAWRGDDERVPSDTDVWDMWWAELDGLDRECLKVRAAVEHQDRLWAELVQETRQLCPLAAA